MNNIPMRTLLASTLLTLALALPACGESSDPTTTVSSVSNDTNGTTGGNDDTTTGDDPSTSTTDEPTTGATEGVNPCDQCDANALCDQDGKCECKTGFDGNGLTCEDIDECATGQDNCSADAACTNTPGGFTCDCNDGYDGDGFDCKDVDECADDLHNCSPLADCTNKDGSFECECKDGFTGDGVICNGNKEFGETCELSEECASGICLTDGGCTVQCSVQVAHDCRDQGLSGLCVATNQPDLYVCLGDFNGGADKDDTVIVPGDSAMRQFQSASDADLFLINHGTKDILFFAEPDLDDDVQLEVWSFGGASLGVVNDAPAGMAEGATLQVNGTAGSVYVIVRNIGNTNGNYKFSVQNQ